MNADSPASEPQAKAPDAAPRRGRLRLVLGLAIGVAALVLAMWGVPFDQVLTTLHGARWWWLLGIAALFLWQQAMRAWRQLVIIRAIRPDSSYRTNLSVLCISFLAINTVPGRLGEIVRPLLLLEREQVPLGIGFALVFLERVLDLCATFGMLAAVALIFPPPSHLIRLGGAEIDWVPLARGAAITMLPAVILVVAIAALLGEQLIAWARPVVATGPRTWRLAGAAGLRFATTFVSGLRAVRSPARLFGVIVLTFVIWSVSIWMYPMAAQAFGIGPLVGYGQGVGVLAISMLGGIAPAPPGQAGTYEAFVRAGLALYGIAGTGPTPDGIAPSVDAAVIAFALTMHWGIMFVQALTALYFLVVDRVDLPGLLALVRSGGWRQLDTDSPPEHQGLPGEDSSL
ncbi:MAG: flippase-like domain-containing protein [Oligoflexia bacterium]|nr:flippase-like domain-containing protein [Oligoflexia bacterium]